MNGMQSIKELAAPIYEAKGWMKLAGVLSIIQGVILVFTLWGIIVCWIPIWMGATLLTASDRVKQAFEADSEEDMKVALERIGKYFKIFGIFALVMLVVAIVGIIAAILIPAMMKSKMPI